MMKKLEHTLHLFVLIAALAGFYQITTAAQAMNVYNNSTQQITVDFDCGWFCSNDWEVAPNTMKSRPNESGDLTASIASYGCDVDVDTHGWVVATGSNVESIELTSYHQDGSVNTTCTFVYQSRLGQDAPLIVTSDADSGDGSLRSVIAQASSGDTITFAYNVETIGLSSTLVIGTDVTISGPVTLEGNNQTNVLTVSSDAAVTLNNLTITGGYNTDSAYGGGIINNGMLDLSDCTVSGNKVENGGGGIYNNLGSTLTVTNSTFSGNSASFGASILNEAGDVTVTNSTFSGNTAVGDSAGISNRLNSILTVTNSTFSGNTAQSGTGITNIGTLTINNSIVANNTTGHGSDIDAPPPYNYRGSNNIVDIDPGLDPTGLKGNGGLTQTIALVAGSPALDAANSAICPATDQRGVTRPQGSSCDIGAYELEVAP